MSQANLEALETAALRLTPVERGTLIARLVDSLEGEPEDTPEAIAKAWDEEITRRIADLEAGNTTAVPYEEVRAEMRALIANHGK